MPSICGNGTRGNLVKHEDRTGLIREKLRSNMANCTNTKLLLPSILRATNHSPNHNSARTFPSLLISSTFLLHLWSGLKFYERGNLALSGNWYRGYSFSICWWRKSLEWFAGRVDQGKESRLASNVSAFDLNSDVDLGVSIIFVKGRHVFLNGWFAGSHSGQPSFSEIFFPKTSVFQTRFTSQWTEVYLGLTWGYHLKYQCFALLLTRATHCWEAQTLPNPLLQVTCCQPFVAATISFRVWDVVLINSSSKSDWLSPKNREINRFCQVISLCENCWKFRIIFGPRV